MTNLKLDKDHFGTEEEGKGRDDVHVARRRGDKRSRDVGARDGQFRQIIHRKGERERRWCCCVGTFAPLFFFF